MGYQSAGDGPRPRRRAVIGTWDASLKRVTDFGVALAGLLMLSPLLLLLAVLVKLDSCGPALYRRRVLGRGGAQFDAFKFRTMVVNGDEVLAAHPDLRATLARDEKLKVDPRITRLGGWLRKFSLDELPQLVNVVRGQMSLVGPRMIAPSELVRYGQQTAELLNVKPGLTGLWQISGRSDLGYAERVRLDMEYVRTRTVWLDLRILLATLPAIIRGRGAY